MEEDTTYVPLNDVYYRRLFIPIMIAMLLFLGCFAIIRGSPGATWNMAQQFGGSWRKMGSK
jgi:hypothetical protein